MAESVFQTHFFELLEMSNVGIETPKKLKELQIGFDSPTSKLIQ